MVKRMLEAQCGKPHRYGTQKPRTKQGGICLILKATPPPPAKIDIPTPSENQTYTHKRTTPQPFVVTQRSYELITKSRVYIKLRRSGVVPKIITDNRTMANLLVHPPKQLTRRLTGKQPDPRTDIPLRRPEEQAAP